MDFLLHHTPLLYLTQSLWRDEAFSVFIAEHSIVEIITLTSHDFNPPLYYILLHVWMMIFGSSVVALRLFSFSAFILLVVCVYAFAKKIWHTSYAVWIATTLTLVNPMLVYFAFELRMYAIFALFGTASMYFLYEKKWPYYILVSVAGLYTQPFMAFVLLAQGVYAVLTKTWRVLIRSWIAIAVLFLPWVPTLLHQFMQSASSWIYPVDFQLIRSVIGNLYFGYEGTPAGLWNIMAVFSLCIIAMTIMVLYQTKKRSHSVLFAAWVFIPLILVLGISFVKPLYVHRYLIFISVGEIFLITSFFQKHNKKAMTAITILFIVFTAATNIYAAPFHYKTNYKQTVDEIKTLAQPSDVLYAQTPLNYFELRYYAKGAMNVYLYNPDAVMPPVYVGSVGMPQSVWKDTFPLFPHRAFLIHSDGTFETVSSL